MVSSLKTNDSGIRSRSPRTASCNATRLGILLLTLDLAYSESCGLLSSKPFQFIWVNSVSKTGCLRGKAEELTSEQLERNMLPHQKTTAVILGSFIAFTVGASSTFAGEGRVTMVEDEGRAITIDSGGEKIISKISESRTNVMINGADAKPEDVRVGMNCVTDVANSGDEATTFDCLTEN